MILIDANLLIYSYDEASPFYREAASWLEAAFSTEPAVGMSWSAILAFVRFATNPKLRRPVSFDAAFGVVERWIDQPETRILTPGPKHWSLLAGLIREGSAFGPLVTDAHIAALAIEHGATLCTHDRDFTRFSKLKLRYPLS
ncbi:MAG: TA system VapC family ribonuclease toxin [Bryobacteraceae bacterium]|nr:TA system VapC family ribonuclease toxin [Bryobacteraceae bacterium]